MSLLERQHLPEDRNVKPDVPAEEPGQVSQAQDKAAEPDLRSGRRASHGEHALTPGDFARAIALMETVSQTEQDIAHTLRVMAETDGSEAAARRLRLAEDAVKGAQEAAEHAERLHRQADRWARHADETALSRSLRHAGKVLADLARTEKDIAGTLTSLASLSRPDQAAQLRQLAEEASAGAQRADDRARSLHDLAVSLARKSSHSSRST